MANIISIGTALPAYKHSQQNILCFMQKAYGLNDIESRKLAFLYSRSSITHRYSVLDKFSNTNAATEFAKNEDGNDPSLNERMKLFQKHALPLSLAAIQQCITGYIEPLQITHLITVSCTGMSAPGLDLEIMNALSLPPHTFRTSVNFMGCYGAIHALKLAQMICASSPGSTVLIVATELCTIHFQSEYNYDNAASSLLFSDGSAAVLISDTYTYPNALNLKSFYSHVAKKGINDMTWKISDKGFLMTLSAYVPDLINEDIAYLIQQALQHARLNATDISHWCIHPGGRKILDVIQKKTGLCDCDLAYSANVLSAYGNMSSPSILFVLKEIMKATPVASNVLGVAFGPGLTMETFIASSI